LLVINRQLTKRNNRSKMSIYKRSKRRKSDKEENNAKLRKEKRSFFRYFCKNNGETYKLKILSFESIVIINLFNLLIVIFTTCR